MRARIRVGTPTLAFFDSRRGLPRFLQGVCRVITARARKADDAGADGLIAADRITDAGDGWLQRPFVSAM